MLARRQVHHPEFDRQRAIEVVTRGQRRRAATRARLGEKLQQTIGRPQDLCTKIKNSNSRQPVSTRGYNPRLPIDK
jgi:hypothetical protein